MSFSEEQRALYGLWRQHKYDLVALSESLREQVNADHRYLVWDYVDHDEIGIAFDHLLYALFDEPNQPATLSPEQAETTLRLGKAMEYRVDSSIVYKIFLSTYFPEEVARAEEI